MPRIKTATSTVPTARKPVHFHLLLRPVLQKAFARSSLWTFVVCCAVSYLIGHRFGIHQRDFLRDADAHLALRLLLRWTVTYSRGFIVFATLFPVLISRQAELHGMTPARDSDNAQSSSTLTLRRSQ